MNSFVQIVGCNGTALYESSRYEVKFNTSGRLEVLIAYDGMLLLKLHDFQYNIKPSQQIQCDKNDPQFQIVFKLPKSGGGKWILKINEHADEVYSCLNEKCYLTNLGQQKKQYSSSDAAEQKERKNEEDKKKAKQQKQNKKIESEENDQEDDINEKKNSITAGDIVVGASKGLGWGLKMTGKILSKGFEVVGSLTSKVVKPAAEKVQVSDSTKANLELAKKSTKSFLGFASTQVGNLMKFGKEAASNVGQRFQKSEKGKQLQENKRYESIKNSTKVGVQAFANIYDGVVVGVYEIGSGISKGATKIIGKKYGDEAEQAADDAFEGVGNIVKITRVPEDQIAKNLK